MDNNFNIKQIKQDRDNARIVLNEKENLIKNYFKCQLNEIKEFLINKEELKNYSRLLRIKYKTGSLAGCLDFSYLKGLYIVKINLYNNTCELEVASTGFWCNYYIHLSYDKLEVFTKDYIESKFEYERKLQLAEKKVEDLKNIERELVFLERKIESTKATYIKTQERYNYLKSISKKGK